MLRERPFSFPWDKTLRVICDTDANNEADDQYMIAHLLMTPRFEVKALIAEQYGIAKHPHSMQRSFQEIETIVELMGLSGSVNILRGAETAMSAPDAPIESEGARFLIEEALRDDPRPLFVCCTGAITNLASALALEPSIAERITVIWIGGGAYPKGEFEYNFFQDTAAATAVFRSGAEIWQVPKPVYITMKVSFFELLGRVYPCGALGKYLVEKTMEVAAQEKRGMEDPSTPLGKRFLTMSPGAASTSFAGELWCLGDSPVVGLMMNHTLGHFHMQPAPWGVNPDCTYDFSRPGREQVRVYDDIDSRFILMDLFEKLSYYFGS